MTISILLIEIVSFAQVHQFPITAPSVPSKKIARQGLVVMPPASSARALQSKPGIDRVNGSFRVSFDNGERKSIQSVSNEFNAWFNLSKDHSFYQSQIRKDELGISHIQYQQYYKGYPIEYGNVLIHSKNEWVSSVNGKVNEFSEIETQINVSTFDAINIAKSHLKVNNLINEYPVETIITTISKDGASINKLVHKVRIDSYNPFVMCHIYVDVKTGEIINRINLIAHVDAPATAKTLYSGTKQITNDLNSNSYRLRESARSIETYDATNATGITTSGFTNSIDFTNASSNWEGVSSLSSITVSNVAQAWWFTAFSDELPDLYFIIKDGSGKVIFTSNYVTDTNPPIEVKNLNIILTHPPYTLEIWDRDISGGDDFGGSYPIALNIGTQPWGGNGNTGTYTINTIGNPALDIHWGMEETYDFYLNTFNRKSYDGKGNVIRQYLNPPVYQQSQNGDPNNAGAQPPPYNVMQYGMGDNQAMHPLVALDVEGHEFTHMVIYNSIFDGAGRPVGLTYMGESGALNESFADIMGVGVEFYGGTDPDWVIGEDVTINAPYLRSLADPNKMGQPDTYKGQFWMDATNIPVDHGGVHTNSGVQNFWYYLLSQGGTGTNDLGNPYTVTGIGLAQSQQIAYRNLTTQLLPGATYLDAYNGSLQAAEDLYGNPSLQYTAVRQAWYAVGIGSDPSNYCSGLTTIKESNGTITDGSGTANYNNNANCKWLIAPPGATQVSLAFTEFDTEAEHDTVIVYDGPGNTYLVLVKWWGNTLPQSITTTAGNGAMFIEFKSDNDKNAEGWSANYTSVGEVASCGGGNVLSAPAGTFGDGSGLNNYGNNQLCYWFIAPPCASRVTLTFSEFNTERDHDVISVYSDFTQKTLLATFSGANVSTAITSTTGKMLVVFSSDYSKTMSGFAASYTSIGSPRCSGVTTVNTSDSGVISDGSGAEPYCNNSDCSWLIQPAQATSVSLSFSAFDLQPGSADGQSIYDAIEIYDGATTTSPLLGRFAGGNIPPVITSSGGSMLVRFYSDLDDSRQGWTAYYTSTQSPSCSGVTTFTEASGTFTDGSGESAYSNNNSCSWLIQPTTGKYITLSFSTFNTELKNDGVIVYDGADNTAPVLGRFSGNAIPRSVTAESGSMYVEFLTGPSIRGEGWTAHYVSSLTTGIENEVSSSIKVFPNPTHGIVNINSKSEKSFSLEVLDLLGRPVSSKCMINKGSNQLDLSGLSKGFYFLLFKREGVVYSERIIVK